MWKLVLRALACCAVLHVGLAHAAVNYWIGTTNSLWSEPTNWSRGTPAASHDIEIIRTSGSPARYNPVNVDAPVTVKSLTFNSSILGPAGLTGSAITLNGDVAAQSTSFAVSIANSIALNGNRTFTVAAVSGGPAMTISGAISGANRDLIKDGAGTLLLSGANTYSGKTEVQAGALRIAAGSLSPGLLRFYDGGAHTNVLEMSGTFNRTVGGGAGNVQWGRGGGFSAFGGNLLVDLNVSETRDTLAWGATSFLQNNDWLVFGSTQSNGAVTWFDNLSLGSAASQTRTMKVIDNPNSIADRTIFTGAITGSLAGSNYLDKQGDGLLELASVNTYAAATRVSQGTLLVSGTLDTSTLGVTVLSGARLAGGGVINRPVTLQSGGILSPGSSAGTLTTGSLTLNSGSIYEWELGSSLSSYDRVAAGTLILPSGGTIRLKLSNLNGLNPAGHSFDLITWTGADPLYTNVNWLLDYGTTGWSDYSVITDLVNNRILLVVPEPITLSLLSVGVLLILRRRSAM